MKDNQKNFSIEKFGLFLRDLRKSNGLSIRELSRKADVSNAYLSQLENGQRGKPSPDIIKKIAPHLGEYAYQDLMKEAEYIDGEINEEVLQLMNNTKDIEKVLEYAFDIFMDSITTHGIIDKDIRDGMLTLAKDTDPDGKFLTEESIKIKETWRLMFDKLEFQEKVQFLLFIKQDSDKNTKIDNFKNNVAEASSYYSKKDFDSVSTVKVPILGYIAAGEPIFAEEHIIDYEEVPNIDNYKDGHLFMLIVKGDSMIGSRIYPGDKVLVKVQPEIENGEIAVVNINGDAATLKKIKKYDDGSVWLISTNQEYAPIPLKNTNSRIIGKVIRVIFEP